jgi:hypothetical protein
MDYGHQREPAIGLFSADSARNDDAERRSISARKGFRSGGDHFASGEKCLARITIDHPQRTAPNMKRREHADDNCGVGEKRISIAPERRLEQKRDNFPAGRPAGSDRGKTALKSRR